MDELNKKIDFITKSIKRARKEFPKDKEMRNSTKYSMYLTV